MNDQAITQDNDGGDRATIEIAGDVVSAYLSNNSMRPEEVVDFIKKVREAFSTPLGGAARNGHGDGDGGRPVGTGRLSDADYKKVLKATVFDDGIVSLENGEKFKTLKRHLTTLGMTIEGYREKHGLHADYPTVCKDYSAVRSGLAKDIGLGKKKAA